MMGEYPDGKPRGKEGAHDEVTKRETDRVRVNATEEACQVT